MSPSDSAPRAWVADDLRRDQSWIIRLGPAEAGERVLATLWHDPESGTVLLVNEHGDRMPVETLWCGLHGRSWQTRSPIPLDRTPGEAPGAIELDCRVANDRLACAAVHR